MARKKPITGSVSGRGSGSAAPMKPQKSRALIRKFHVLLKQQATATGATKELLQHEMDQLGGLKTYQAASIAGQSAARGGDSSKQLVKWLKEMPLLDISGPLLEVGALQIDNSIARYHKFSRIDRLDLNSQHPKIEQQDFMERPIPSTESKYAALSLSLVVNFVPDASTRGEMLKRTTQFLKPDGLLFFVLPAPCITNSRYCSKGQIDKIMDLLGFEELQFRTTAKLAYWLFRRMSSAKPKLKAQVPKTLLNAGPGRNNFCIILEPHI